MDDNSRVGKYIRLFGNIFFTFIGFLLSLALLILLLKLFFGLLDKFRITSFLYTLFVILVPACFFIAVNLYYWKRTRSYQVAWAKIISFVLFSIMLASWSTCLVRDVYTYFTSGHQDIGSYWSFSLVMLAGSVFLVFLVGIIQALAAPAEPDWLTKAK